MDRGILALALVCLLSSPARAGSDYRWTDRFFWGVGFGVVQPMEEPPPSEQRRRGAVDFEISYWWSDFVGARVALVGSDYAADWGLDLFGAVPLRYVQLYGGPHLGLRNPEETDPMAVDPGSDLQIHGLVGVQGYLGRNGRLFVQWEGDADLNAVTAGLRWSPDAYHRARTLNKLDLVWCSTLLTFAIWGLASASQD